VSTYALIRGYKNHDNFAYLACGISGLSLLVFAILMASLFGELAEKSLTIFGSLLVIYAHFKNHQICKKLNCDCHSLESS
jgi:uncharacterized membrane protein